MAEPQNQPNTNDVAHKMSGLWKKVKFGSFLFSLILLIVWLVSSLISPQIGYNIDKLDQSNSIDPDDIGVFNPKDSQFSDVLLESIVLVPDVDNFSNFFKEHCPKTKFKFHQKASSWVVGKYIDLESIIQFGTQETKETPLQKEKFLQVDGCGDAEDEQLDIESRYELDFKIPVSVTADAESRNIKFTESREPRTSHRVFDALNLILKFTGHKIVDFAEIENHDKKRGTKKDNDHRAYFAEANGNGYTYYKKGVIHTRFTNGAMLPINYTVNWIEVPKIIETKKPKDSQPKQNEGRVWASKCRRKNFDMTCSVQLAIDHWYNDKDGESNGPYNDDYIFQIGNSVEENIEFLVNFVDERSPELIANFGVDKDSRIKGIRKFVSPAPHGFGSPASDSRWFHLSEKDTDLIRSDETYDYSFHTRLRYTIDGRKFEPMFKLLLKVEDREMCAINGGKACKIKKMFFIELNEGKTKKLYCSLYKARCSANEI